MLARRVFGSLTVALPRSFRHHTQVTLAPLTIVNPHNCAITTPANARLAINMTAYSVL